MRIYVEHMYTLCTQGVNDDVVVDEDTILFMHDTTSWEALDVHKIKLILLKTLPKARKWS